MLSPGFDDPVALAPLRGLFRQGTPRPSLALPGALPVEWAGALRVGLGIEGTRRFDVADRGRYAVNDTLVDGPLFEELAQFAAALCDRRLHVGPARWLRLGRGDYELVRGDVTDRAARGLSGPHLEVVLDFSAATLGRFECVYADGTAPFVVPQWAGSVALIVDHKRQSR